jgi:hypothetical protein
MEIVFIFLLLVALLLTIIRIAGYREGDDARQMILGFSEGSAAFFSFYVLGMLLARKVSIEIVISTLILSPLIFIVIRSVILAHQRRWARFKGIIAAAVVLTLLYGGCWFLLANSNL